MTLTVLLEDAHLLAVDKPPGQLVIPGRGPSERTVKDDAEAEHGKLWVVHRLDRGTSGVLVFARSAAAHRALNMAFDRRDVEKRYLALVRGAPPDAFRVEAGIAPARRGRMRPARPGDARAKPAATAFRTVRRIPPPPSWGLGDEPLALVEALPETGRTHQIRVHLAHAGHPLLVDPDYGAPGPIRDADGTVVLDRTPLHAWALRFRHPAEDREVAIEAPLPADMRRVADQGG